MIAIGLAALTGGALPARAQSETKETPAVQATGDAEASALRAEERLEADRLRRRGDPEAAARRLEELLEGDAADAESRRLFALCLRDQAAYGRALEEAQAALAAAPTGARAERAACIRTAAEVLSTLGRAPEALALCDEHETDLAPTVEPRDAWTIGDAAWQSGQRERARRLFAIGARASGAKGWEQALARGRCQRRLGDIEASSRTLIEADQAAKEAEGVEPDVLAALADLYFEADREVERAKHRSAADLYKEALSQNPRHEGAALGLFELHRYNWLRRSRPAEEILSEFLARVPGSIDGGIAACRADLDDGQLKGARERLASLSALAPRRREVRTLAAALAWIEHRRDAAEAELADLAREDPEDSRPEREVAEHLLELYRFAEGLPFAKRATERDSHDWEAWTQLGRALANTGDEDGARAAFTRAQAESGLRQDAWRDNMRLVLERMSTEMKRETHGELSFAWGAGASEVLRTYLVPFYSEARAELASRYGFTPGPTSIEVFQRHRDFSVRSTGFEGFPALGVCFGPVVTAVSPVSELRGTFSWARTSFHEFTHVIHLGLSHNRCPRWITEGLATWEEVHRNPDWTRNMRRELVDAKANGDVIPVRELNRAFRGPRILFGYYQGGLLCGMLIEQHGFPPMIRLLEAFDRGLDLDQAFAEVFHTTPEEIDLQFGREVDRLTAGLALEPRWSPGKVQLLRARLPRKAPEPARAAAWAEDWCTVAWGMWQQGRKVDAQEALRVLQPLSPQPPRARLLRGEIAFAAQEVDKAKEHWFAALDAGAEDYRVRLALGTLALQAGELEEAEKELLAAERAFPGFDDPQASAERRLIDLYDRAERFEDAQRARERWLRWNSGDVKERRKVARWHVESGRQAESLEHYREANEVDPFLRAMHREWGEALAACGQHEEALREFRVGPKVPPELDLDKPGPLEAGERAQWLALEARELAALGRPGEAAEAARAALELDPDCELARETLRRSD